MKAFFVKFKKYVLVALAALLAGFGYLVYGVDIDGGKVLAGDVGGVGESIEHAPE